VSTLETFTAGTSLTSFFGDLTDTELVARVQAGEPQFFAVLYDRHVTAVTRVCAARLPQPELVQDAVQETFARALAALPGFTGGARFGHWLKRIAKNASIDLLRQRARLSFQDDQPTQLADRQAETAFARCLDRHAVAAVLGRLDRRDAAMLVAHHMDDEPLTATAERWSTTPASAAVMLHRARRKAGRSARAEGLALVPAAFTPLRRLMRQLRERFPGGEDAVASLFSVTSAQLVIAVALAVPAMASGATTAAPQDTAPPTLIAPPVAEPAPALPGVAAPLPASPVAAAPLSPAAPAHAPPAAGPAPGAAAGPGTSAPPPPPVPLPEVAMEPLGTRVHQEAPPNPDYAYGVDPPLVTDARPGIVADDEPETEPVDQVGCAVAELGEPLTYCDQAPDQAPE